MAYKCMACGKQFTTPKEDTDDQGDEMYFSCPKCGSEDYFEVVGTADEKLKRARFLGLPIPSDYGI